MKNILKLLVLTSVISTFSGCSTIKRWNFFKSSSNDSNYSEGLSRTYERDSWWPWGELDTETPTQKSARKAIEKNQKEMLKKAKEGDAGMQILAGTFFARSENVDEVNVQEAAKWFYMAIHNEKVTSIQKITACFHYAMCLEIAEYQKKDERVKDKVRQEIISNYKTAADITLISRRDKTVNGYQQLACYNLACYYEMDKQEQDAYIYFKKAADLDHIEAAYKVAKYCLDEDSKLFQPKVAAQYLIKIASQEHQKAQVLLADCYEAGLGVDLDYSLMIRWLSLAAKGETGSPEAQTKLGKCYALGKGVVPDYSLAVQWYERAAEKGYGLAMFELANCYYAGIGVPVDYYKAVHWYEEAIKHKQAAGYYGLGVCADNGFGMKQDPKLAFEYFNKAISLDDKLFVVYYKIAEFYRFGRGEVKKDMKKAVQCYQKAGENGFVDAWLELALLFASGIEGINKNLSNAAYCLQEAEDILKYYPRADIAARIVQLRTKFKIPDLKHPQN